MSNYSMCRIETCTVKTSCGRYTTQPTVDHQSYVTAGGYVTGDERCSLYWKTDTVASLEAEVVELKEELAEAEAEAEKKA